MTSFSKCLAVLATVASLAFLGLASLAAVGGPNYEAETNDPSLADVVFEQKRNEETGQVTWSAQSRLPIPVDPNNPASAYEQKSISQDEKVLAKVLIESHAFQKKQQTQRKQYLDAQITLRIKQIAEAKSMYKIDKVAMELRIKTLTTQLAVKHAALKTVLAAIVTTREDELKKRNEAKRRRSDIRRLGNLIKELQADRQRLLVQQSKLTKQVETVEGDNRRLLRRNLQLKKRIAKSAGTVATP